MALYTRNEVLQFARKCTENMGASYTNSDKANRIELYKKALQVMAQLNIETVETRKDYSLGHIHEALHNAFYTGNKVATFARAWQPDFNQGRIEVEIKVSVNSKDLATPVKKPTRVHFLTVNGWVEITKKTMTEIFENPEEYSEYVKEKNGGLVLKVKAYEIGKPIKVLNELYGF
jgi:hypothetical protein